MMAISFGGCCGALSTKRCRFVRELTSVARASSLYDSNLRDSNREPGGGGHTNKITEIIRGINNEHEGGEFGSTASSGKGETEVGGDSFQGDATATRYTEEREVRGQCKNQR